MQAIGFKQSLPITEDNSFIQFETEKPTPTGHDLLVRVSAVSVNPVDFKIRQIDAKDEPLEIPKIIGWDAVGTVAAIGDQVTLFQPGDKVFYAGDLTRPGSNAEFQLVDERIVGKKPSNLTDAEAAAIPLTGLTAYESLFDRIKIDPEADAGKSVLILAGAGGVGSIAIQLATQIGKLTVIATASRPETVAWCEKMGADHVVNHHDLLAELDRIGHAEVDYILDFVDLGSYWETIAKIIKPQGHIVSISDSGTGIDLNLLKSKSVTFSWEFMYTRSMYTTKDIARQHQILNHLAELLDAGIIQTTLKKTLEGFTVANHQEAHRFQESGKAIGKTVITYY
ncbi:MAG: zinc-binding alcohol dehydrogenase family protein [Bacteroidota bacterium]